MTRPGNRRHDKPDIPILLQRNRIGEDIDWHGRASCANPDHDPEMWFRDAQWPDAIAICSTCPVRTECADYAIANREQHGVFGGLTPEQRDRITAGVA